MRYINLLILAAVASCSPIATYPPIETDVAVRFSDSTKEPVPTIMAKILVYAHENYGGMDTIIFNLPAGVGEETYSIVSNRIGEALPMTSANQPAFHIIELRVRGFSADADVVFPSRGGNYAMATIRLKSSIFDPWEVVDDRVWDIKTVAVPKPNYKHPLSHDVILNP